ncbi:winged helix-turn-helix domain-containing protein [Microbacterium karelineae]|uniref:winged helix-turn-helix domain-containing protein n=1 Tax=Microbacterium karelineae TaxID=2654283 RepID=UPI0012E9BF7F|nr:crosslink repair DNA glycosylase YcaQ family protein [Microbacterium karelineae]
MARTTLSQAEARRTALAAQGLGGARSGATGGRSLSAAIARMGVLQIDSVNVFARSHYMPLFSRVGSYDPARLDRLVFRKGRASRPAPYVEYIAHEAAFMPVEDWPLWAFRRADVTARSGRWGAWAAAPDNADVIARVRAELADRGPLRPADIESVVRTARGGPWWDWDHAKRALEYLWAGGEVAIAGREGFERVYGLAEHIVPPHLLGVDVARPDAVRELVRRAAKAYGVATLSDLNDYYRLRDQRAVQAAVDDLVDAGELSPVRVEGWTNAAGRPLPAWIHRDARVPRRIEQATLLTPFDPVVWFRDRAERLFDFHYRIEIYVPQPKRRYGYYSLPVLVDDRVAGRIDLKAERKASALRVQSAWWEEHASAGHAAERIAAEVARAAAWQGLERVTVSRWGDASDHLAAALDAERHEHANAKGM